MCALLFRLRLKKEAKKVIRRFLQTTILFVGFYTFLRLLECWGAGSAKENFFVGYMVFASIFILMVLFLFFRINLNEENLGKLSRYSKPVIFVVYAVIATLITLMPVLLALVITLLFKIEFYSSFAIVEFFAYAIVSIIYVIPSTKIDDVQVAKCVNISDSDNVIDFNLARKAKLAKRFNNFNSGV